MKFGVNLFVIALVCAAAGRVLQWMHEADWAALPFALTAISLGASMWLIGTAMPDGDFDDNLPID